MLYYKNINKKATEEIVRRFERHLTEIDLLLTSCQGNQQLRRYSGVYLKVFTVSRGIKIVIIIKDN
jgi:hypothetical protein